jgi:beta-glucanase (GH16 family)
MIKKIVLLPALVLFSLALVTSCVTAEPPVGYHLVWSDEFDAPALDTNKWFYRTGERLLSLQMPENVSVTNGRLRIALKKEKVGDIQYTAGGIISRQDFRYGYFEARFRCPPGAGWHTAFWTMQYHPDMGSTNIMDYAQRVENGSGAVQSQEIDICEQDSVDPNSYSAGVIDWSRQSSRVSTGFGRKYFRAPREDVPDFSADFHTWGCEFSPANVKFFLDGKLTHETDATRFPHGDQKIWLTCVGALWGDPVKPKSIDDNKLPAYVEFDWVRVYIK